MHYRVADAQKRRHRPGAFALAVEQPQRVVLDGYNSLFTLWHLSRTSDTQTDAQTMAQLTWLPASVWVVFDAEAVRASPRLRHGSQCR